MFSELTKPFTRHVEVFALVQKDVFKHLVFVLVLDDQFFVLIGLWLCFGLAMPTILSIIKPILQRKEMSESLVSLVSIMIEHLRELLKLSFCVSS